MFFGVVEIEAIEFAGKETRFVAAGAGADFDDGGFIIGRVAGN